VTKRRQQALQRYVNKLRPMLGLRDWEVVVKQEPPDNPSHDASHQSVMGCRLSLIRVADRFWTYTPEQQREVILHELLHCVFAPTQDQIRHILPSHLRGRGGEVFREMWFQSQEYAIDQLSVALGRHFPLPELP